MKNFVFWTIALCMVTPAFSAEVWECLPGSGQLGGEPVFAVAGENSNITMAGKTNDTHYKVEAINRVWNWGLGELLIMGEIRPDLYRYEFRIENGIRGFFYDDKPGRGISVKDIYTCHKERK